MGKKQKQRIKALEELVDVLQKGYFNLYDKLNQLEARDLPNTPKKAPVAPLGVDPWGWPSPWKIDPNAPWTFVGDDPPKVSMSEEMKNELMEGMSTWDSLTWEAQHQNSPDDQSDMEPAPQDSEGFQEYLKMFCAEADKQNAAYFHAGGENWPMGNPGANSEGEPQ